jgi:transposase-like protein
MAKIRSSEKQSEFLTVLSECGNVTEAAARVEIGRSTIYEWRAQDEQFAAEWDAAAHMGLLGLEDEARRRARGFEETVIIDGKPTTRTVRSDTLLIFLLKGGMPDKYRERISTEITGREGGPIDVAYSRFVGMPTEVLEEMEAEIQKRFYAAQADDPDDA